MNYPDPPAPTSAFVPPERDTLERLLTTLVHALSLLKTGEGLEEPFRDGARIVLPIITPRATAEPPPAAGSTPADAEALQALLDAWLH